jgi:hypothetical protein
MIDTGSISDETDLLAVTSELFDRDTVMPDHPTHQADYRIVGFAKAHSHFRLLRSSGPGGNRDTTPK